MFFTLRYVCLAALVAVPASAARLTFDRTIPPRRNLGGAQDLVINYAVGDNDKISTFLDVFVNQTNKAETLRVIDATNLEHSTERSHRWRSRPKYTERKYPADAYLRIEAFSCRTTDLVGQGSTFDVDGNRIRRNQHWIDAVCEAHIDVLAKNEKKKIAEFSVRGEGTSARVDKLSDEDRATAVDRAARYAAVLAAEEITPRRVHEMITLADDAPSFVTGMAMVDSGRLDDARRFWESALTTHTNSAALHFNLAAVCEALGDLHAAGEHYNAALRLRPDDARYRYERDMFRRRNGEK
ncbi:MAG TPA: tetratricopeptide repeat protein [Thermoanaerobaculia bacterium]